MSRVFEVSKVGGSGARIVDRVAVEEPLEIRVGKVPVVVTMRTPGHDEELAVGLMVTEGVVRSGDDIVSVAHCTSVDEAFKANVVAVDLEHGVSFDPEPVRRGFYASSSCGVCGKTSIDQVRRTVAPVGDGFTIDVDVLRRLPETLRRGQKVFEETGGLHAAGLFDRAGALACLREDVGRHNAVDKVIGWSVMAARRPLDDCVLMVSGRSSFEIVQKALVGRIPVVASVSAASSLAVELASAGCQTLVGFLREGGMVVYAGGERLVDGVDGPARVTREDASS